ncbi:MAG: amidohydrolase [Bacteroidetes bacterium MedPE-SWsnd-G1]|nr:MAG: amidohydrolase [Bacteroidetes bacterium MedPE-SWsnd-G1]
MKKLLLGCLFIFIITSIKAQDYFPTNTSVKTINNSITVFTNATIHTDPSNFITNGTLIIQNEKIISVGKNLDIPKNAIVIDLNGKHIYPSFIDLYSNFGIAKSKRPSSSSRRPQYDATRKGYYWNDHILTDQRGFEDYKFDAKKAKELHAAGFGVVSSHQRDGIMRGTGIIAALTPNNGVLETDATQHLSFSKSVKSRQGYPYSVMGSMALIRQAYFDADWYAGGHSKTKDLALEALNSNKSLPIIFEGNSLDNTLRAAKIGKEFGLTYTIKGSGFEYEAIEEIKASGANFIVPINFPKPYDVSNPEMAALLNLQDMRQWNQAPSNLKVLAENDVQFALTTADLKSIKSFKSNLLKAIEYGLDKEKALAALTTVPAEILGKSNEIGSLKSGSYANFLITSDEIFEKKTILYENWVQGAKNVITNKELVDIRGNYELALDGKKYTLNISGELSKLKSELKLDSLKIASSINYKDGWINLLFNPLNESKTEFVRLTAAAPDNSALKGEGTLANGSATSWTATKIDGNKDKKKDSKKSQESPIVKPLTYPNVAYGFTNKPTQQTTLYKNATVWTNESEGILQNTDVLVKDGKISKIGQGLKASGATVVDATGKHLTSGVIDEHSHIAASSINEGGHNSTAEVTIEDVIDPDDIGIYRTLSGGVTTIQILHGSANPIGGRSALIKLKWGESANGLLYKDRPKFIKFALGENVKQSRSTTSYRFPQTRMGVEQLYIDYFQRAKEYDALKKSGKPYRKDLELETLAEILNKERFISCHSYVQSEINMLMKVAEKFDFNINTFTHILEGYKVADKMKEHGVGGSTFSDWWAYKYEVNDAIPYNGAIMHSQGVTVAFNSDDGEMIRRLNQEAAKAVKYGGVSEEEAWKFVTLNPAKLLHIDDKVGSVKVGKDADLVLWNGHPMSIYTKAEQTMIEGVVYYDSERDLQLINDVKTERNELINMMLKEKNKGMKTQLPKKKVKELLHCDSLDKQI